MAGSNDCAQKYKVFYKNWEEIKKIKVLPGVAHDSHDSATPENNKDGAFRKKIDTKNGIHSKF